MCRIQSVLELVIEFMTEGDDECVSYTMYIRRHGRLSVHNDTLSL